MRTVNLIPVFFIGCAISVAQTAITDMDGRTVQLPLEMNRILPYDSKTSVLLFPLLGDKIVAKPLLPGKKEYRNISSSYEAIPELDIKNVEAVLAAAPGIIIAGFYSGDENNERVLKLGTRLHIPVVLIDLSIENLDKTYTFLGTLFNCEKEAEQYAGFLRSVYTFIDSLKKTKGEINSTVYYTIGTSGLLTDPAGSKHTEAFDFLEIPNAARVEIPSGGHAQVNMEQVLMWNPDYIFTAGFQGDQNAYGIISSGNKWQSIKAVMNSRVYKVPVQPFGWFDHPPSVNRVPGLIWLCRIFYGRDEEDTRADIIRFYKLFYKYDLSIVEYNLLFQ